MTTDFLFVFVCWFFLATRFFLREPTAAEVHARLRSFAYRNNARISIKPAWRPRLWDEKDGHDVGARIFMSTGSAVIEVPQPGMTRLDYLAHELGHLVLHLRAEAQSEEAAEAESRRLLRRARFWPRGIWSKAVTIQ